MAKGSQGKTTTAVSLAAGLASFGRRVLLVDTDTQSHSAASLGIEAEAGLFELFDGAEASEVMIEARPSLYLIAGGEQNARLKRSLNTADERIEWQIADMLKPLEEFFHYIIIDNGPNWDVLATNVMYYADEILAPVTLEPLSMRGFYDHVKRIQRISQYSGGILRYLLPTMQDKRVAQSGEILTQLSDRFDAIMCDPIRIDIRLSEAPAHGQTIFEYAPKSRGAEDYQKLIDKVIADE